MIFFFPYITISSSGASSMIAELDFLIGILVVIGHISQCHILFSCIIIITIVIILGSILLLCYMSIFYWLAPWTWV